MKLTLRRAYRPIAKGSPAERTPRNVGREALS
jgi:hypothetical protein